MIEVAELIQLMSFHLSILNSLFSKLIVFGCNFVNRIIINNTL